MKSEAMQTNFKKAFGIFLSKPHLSETMKLGEKYRSIKALWIGSNDAPRLTFDILKKMLNFFVLALYGKILSLFSKLS